MVFFGTFAADGAHFAFGARWLIAHSCIANKKKTTTTTVIRGVDE